VTHGDGFSIIDRIGERMPLYADNLDQRHHPSPGRGIGFLDKDDFEAATKAVEKAVEETGGPVTFK
jgi:hypothetical protein